MYRVLPHFRSPKTLAALDAFLCDHPLKAEVLRKLSFGLRGNWDLKCHLLDVQLLII